MRAATCITIVVGLAVIALTLVFGGDSEESGGTRESSRPTHTSVESISGGKQTRGAAPAPPQQPLDPGSTDGVRASLATAIDTYLPGLKLSDNELDAVADATRRLREAQEVLRRLPETSGNAEARSAARAQLLDAVDAFSYVVGMSPAEFTRRVQPGVGVDRDATAGETERLLVPLSQWEPR